MRPHVSLLVVLLAVTLSACGQSDPAKDGAIKDGAVLVDKEIPEVQTKVFAKGALAGRDAVKNRNTVSAKGSLSMDIDAYTEWFYSCHASFDTEEVFHDDTIGAASLALKVKGVKFRLSLPITVYLPKDASGELKEHEDGHVQICSIIYGRAADACVDATRQVSGQTFNGMGRDLSEARAMALSQAQRIVAQKYQEGTAALADQASIKYDDFCRQYADDPKMSRQTLAREACKRVLDVPSNLLK